MSDYPTGVILAYHRNRPEKDFTVILRVTGREYPPVNISKTVSDYQKQDGFTYVWFQEFELPDVPETEQTNEPEVK